MPEFGFIQMFLLLGAVGAALGAGLVHASAPSIADRLAELQPAVRIRRLLLMMAVPLISAAGLVALAFFPSILHAADLVSDHCGSHPDHHLHLCLVHTTHLHTVSTLWWPTLGLASIVAVRGIAAVRRLLGEVSRASELLEGSRRERDGVAWVDLPIPLASTVGIIDPTIVVSSRLRESVEERHLRAVFAHERAHRASRDALLRAIAELLGALNTPTAAARLKEEFSLALEQRADRRAAEAVDNSTDVADAILSVKRALADSEHGSQPGLAFADDHLERRIRALLDPDWDDANRSRNAVGFTAAVGGLALLSPRIHHALETALAWAH